jgi:hypothetical protein
LKLEGKTLVVVVGTVVGTVEEMGRLVVVMVLLVVVVGMVVAVAEGKRKRVGHGKLLKRNVVKMGMDEIYQKRDWNDRQTLKKLKEMKTVMMVMMRRVRVTRVRVTRRRRRT